MSSFPVSEVDILARSFANISAMKSSLNISHFLNCSLVKSYSSGANGSSTSDVKNLSQALHVSVPPAGAKTLRVATVN